MRPNRGCSGRATRAGDLGRWADHGHIKEAIIPGFVAKSRIGTIRCCGSPRHGLFVSSIKLRLDRRVRISCLTNCFGWVLYLAHFATREQEAGSSLFGGVRITCSLFPSLSSAYDATSSIHDHCSNPLFVACAKNPGQASTRGEIR
jgi:hypothetical protein